MNTDGGLYPPTDVSIFAPRPRFVDIWASHLFGMESVAGRQ